MNKNILQIIPEIATGGAEIIVFETAKAIINNGDNCFVFTNGGRLEDAFREIGAQLVLGDAKTKNPFKILKKNVDFLVRFIKEKKIDLVHVHSRAPAISAFIATQKTNIPFITTYHGIYPAKNALKRFYNSFMARADLVIANSQFTKEYLLAQHKIDPSIVRLVYCGVDVEKFSPNNFNENQVAQIVASWNLHVPNSPKVLLPARLTSWKGQKVLIRAAAILNAKNIRPQYILAGDAQGRIEYVEELKSLIAELGVGDLVHLVGHCANVPLAISACDFVVTPSTKEEAFGLTAAEAQAGGKIIIASNLGGAKETVAHGDTGFLFEPNNHVELANYIEKVLMLDNAMREKMGQAAIKRVKEIFSSQLLHEATLKVYDEALKGKLCNKI